MRNKFTKLKTYLNRLVRGNERGVALIFTLGILGLLMVIALAFASTSMVERKVAANVNNNQVAKLLAKSALERIEAGLNAHGLLDPSYLMSHDTNAATYDWLWKMETTDSDVTYSLSSNYDPDSSACPTWQYVIAYKNSTDSEIVGRFAYAVVPNNGKLDPTAVADSSAASIPRPGVSVTEIDIANIDPVFNSKDQVWGQALINELGSNGRWSDLSQLAKAVSADISKLSAYFQVRTTPDPESFWFDLNKDDKVDTGEAFHRFNMVRTDWNTVTVDTICPASATVDSAIAKQYTKTLTDSNDTGGIPWFKNWNSSLDVAGTFGSVADKKNQIVANFIQYSSPETRPVISDVTPSNWLTSEPAYTGNKRTPYLNEVGVNVEIAGSHDGGTDDGSGSGNRIYVVTYDLNVRLGAEMIDIYGIDPALKYTNCLVLVKGNITFDAKNASEMSGWYTVTLPVNDNNTSRKEILLTRGASPYTVNSTGFFPTSLRVSDTGSSASNSLTATYSFTTPSLGAPPTIQVNNIKVNIDKVILLDMSKADSDEVKFLDYTKNLAKNWGSTAQAVPVSNTVYFQAKDPRQNLNGDDWDVLDLGSPGANNANAVPSSGNDLETTSRAGYEGVAAGSHISTAYIRHAPMKSPWELGAIHRGAAWQTLNLNKSASRSSSNALIGGGAYSEGDANLLDQVKFTANTEVYGKVNINTGIPQVLQGLFGGLPYKGDDITTEKYEDPGSGTPIAGSLSTMAASFKDVRDYFNTAKSFSRRTDFLYPKDATAQTKINTFLSDLYSGDARSTDAQKEQLVGKFINLTKAEPLMKDELAVVILTQSIKEAQPGVVVVKDWNSNGNLASTARSTDTNTGKFNSGYRSYKGTDFTPLALTCDIKEYYSDKKIKLCRYENGADQITGECKMIVVYARDTVTGKWKMKRVRYVE